jgi:hypothetical protein
MRNEKRIIDQKNRWKTQDFKQDTGDREEEGPTTQMPVRVNNSPTWRPRHSTSSIPSKYGSGSLPFYQGIKEILENFQNFKYFKIFNDLPYYKFDNMFFSMASKTSR